MEKRAFSEVEAELRAKYNEMIACAKELFGLQGDFHDREALKFENIVDLRSIRSGDFSKFLEK